MKYITVIVFIILATESFAQFTKGDKVLGGTFSFRILGKHENTKGWFNDRWSLRNIRFSLCPKIGILIKSNLEIGSQLGYSRNQSGSGASKSVWQEFTIGFYVQRYFTITEKFLFTLQGEAGYLIEKSFYTSDNQTMEETRRDGLKLKLTPKFIFFPSANWGIHAGLGNISYAYSKEPKSNTTSHSLDISYQDFPLGLGVSYYFKYIKK